jgi:FkbM family methyltransferase
MSLLSFARRRVADWKRPESKALRQMKSEIGHIPRHRHGRVRVWGWDLRFVDAASCISAFDSIVVKRWLDFFSARPDPIILDCGANIGIAVLHFKRLYPAARIVAFEPDHEICQVLKENIEANGVDDVDIHECALWDNNGEMVFNRDGADGGHLSIDSSGTCNSKVRTRTLCGFLQEPVDLLKMDIEGAESHVLRTCGSLLANVGMISLEYHTMFGRRQDLGEILDLLTRNGFRYYINSTGPWRHLNGTIPEPDSPFDQLLMISAKKVSGFRTS